MYKHTAENEFGAVAKVGVIYHYSQNISFEPFVNYLYQRFHFKHPSSDLIVERTDVDLVD